jgi:hypothetical protein
MLVPLTDPRNRLTAQMLDLIAADRKRWADRSRAALSAPPATRIYFKPSSGIGPTTAAAA